MSFLVTESTKFLADEDKHLKIVYFHSYVA